MKKEKEKEPEKLDKMENSAVPKKKGFEEEHKDSDDDSSDDEQVRPRPLSRQTGEATPLSRQTGEATPLVGETGALGGSGCDASFKGPWRPLAGEKSFGSLSFRVSWDVSCHLRVLLTREDCSALGKEAGSPQTVQEEAAPNEPLHCG